MAYTKNDWACGDKITADKLNRMEQGIEDAQNGYECTATYTTLTEETVTVENNYGSYKAALSYDLEEITADTIRVTFNGVEYVCNKLADSDFAGSYGAPETSQLGVYDWSQYPFRINSGSGGIEVVEIHNTFLTQNAGTYTVKIEVPEEVVTTTPCFEKAVKSVANTEPLIISYLYSISGTTNYTIYDKTAQEVQDAFNQGRPIYWKYSSDASYIPPTRIFFESADEGVEAGIVFLRDYEASKWELLETIIDSPSLPSALQPYINHLYTSEEGQN